MEQQEKVILIFDLDTTDNVVLKCGPLSTPGFFDRAAASLSSYLSFKQYFERYIADQEDKEIQQGLVGMIRRDWDRLSTKFYNETKLLCPEGIATLEHYHTLLVIQGLQNEYRAFYNSSEPCEDTVMPSYDHIEPKDGVVSTDDLSSYAVVRRVFPNGDLRVLYIPLDERVKPQFDDWIPEQLAQEKSEDYCAEVYKDVSKVLKNWEDADYYGEEKLEDQYLHWAPWWIPPFPLDAKLSSPGIPFVLTQPRTSAWDALENGDPGSMKTFYINSPREPIGTQPPKPTQPQSGRTPLPSSRLRAAPSQGLQSLAYHQGPSQPPQASQTGSIPGLAMPGFQTVAVPQAASQVGVPNAQFNLPPITLFNGVSSLKVSVTSLWLNHTDIDQNWLNTYLSNPSVNLDHQFTFRGGVDPKGKATTDANIDSRCPQGLDLRIWQEACSLEKDDGIVRTPGVQYAILVNRSVAYAKFRLRRLGFLDDNYQVTNNASTMQYPGSKHIVLSLAPRAPFDKPNRTGARKWDNAVKNAKECLRYPHRGEGGNVARYIEAMLTPGAFQTVAITKIQGN